MWGLWISLVLLATGISVGQCQDINTDEFAYHEKMDDNYNLSWNFNSTHIVFRVVVKTKGYIGLGISGNGKMFPSDVIIGWIEGGETHFADRHAAGYFMPAIDASQDWFLLDSSETQTTTTLTMIRELDTCDPDDMPITKSTTRIIYSYSSDKPRSDNSIRYHGPVSRGARSVLLLQPPSASSDPRPLPSDVVTYDFLNRNFSVPARDTYYACTTFKVNQFQQKHHMIAVEPIIQEGHENLLHHILIYYCTYSLPDRLLGIEYECYSETPVGMETCVHMFVGWAIGGRGYYYPEHVGVSMGTEGDPIYFRMETHYDNPAERDDFVDSSGLRIFLTKQIRQHEAGVLIAGHRVSAYHIIPPYNSNFLTQGYCHQDCLAEALGDQEIHVFANALHSHLLGSKMRARIIRNGVELPFLHADDNYDFNYQDFGPLDEERTIKRGDAIIVDCEYDSSERTDVTYGGLSTRNEMCLSFLFYYPRIQLTRCLSRPVYKEAERTGSEAFFERISNTDWTNQEAQSEFRQALDEAEIQSVCQSDYVITNTNYEFHQSQTAKVNVTQPYTPPDPCQSST